MGELSFEVTRTRLIRSSQIAQHYFHAAKLDHAEEVLSMKFVADNQPAEPVPFLLCRHLHEHSSPKQPQLFIGQVLVSVAMLVVPAESSPSPEAQSQKTIGRQR